MNKQSMTVTERNQKRQKLGDILPLNMPFGIQIDVSNVCDFECAYCLQANKKDFSNLIKFKFMEMDTFKSCIDHILLGGRIKTLHLAGRGEPLIHPNIAEMVSYAKCMNVADSVEIMTNAASLTHKMSDDLINAGLDRLRISMQGLSSEAYRQMSNVNIDFDKFREQIAYFYSKKNLTLVSIKMMDIMLKDEEEENKFHEIFDSICDETTVECLGEVSEKMDYSHLKAEIKEGLFGQPMNDYKICSTPFYHCIISWDGTVLPCCVIPTPTQFGNAANGFYNIWHGKEYNDFLLQLLRGNMSEMPVCCRCTRYSAYMMPNDNIDNYADELIPKYMEKVNI